MPTLPHPKKSTPALILPGRIIEPAGKVLTPQRLEPKGRGQKPGVSAPCKPREVQGKRLPPLF